MVVDATAWDAIRHFLGPNGGEIALAFGAGCAAGYAFCMRTLYKVQCEQHEKAEVALKDLLKDERAKSIMLEERLYGQLRNTGQMRESVTYLLDEGGVNRTFHVPRTYVGKSENDRDDEEK